MPLYRDFLVCGVSRQLHQQIRGFDEIISVQDPDFGASGLQNESLIRLGFLALVPRQRVLGSIGAVSDSRHRRLLERLSGYLTARPRVP
jgi:mRNA interferase MazF